MPPKRTTMTRLHGPRKRTGKAVTFDLEKMMAYEKILPSEYVNDWLVSDKGGQSGQDSLYAFENSNDDWHKVLNQNIISRANLRKVTDMIADADDFSLVFEEVPSSSRSKNRKQTTVVPATPSSTHRATSPASKPPIRQTASPSSKHPTRRTASPSSKKLVRNTYSKVASNDLLRRATIMAALPPEVQNAANESLLAFRPPASSTPVRKSTMRRPAALTPLAERSSAYHCSASFEDESIEAETSVAVPSEQEPATAVEFYLVGYSASRDNYLAQLVFVCGQQGVISWTELFTRFQFNRSSKLGEGSFGDVFRCSTVDDRMVAIKVTPFDAGMGPCPAYNDSPMLRPENVVNEVVLARTMSDLRDSESAAGAATPSFVDFVSAHVVCGLFPEELTSAFDKFKGSENTHPAEYDSLDRHYVIIAFGLGGVDLEKFPVTGERQVLAIFTQVALSLAIAEEAVEFEHRDLHWGNVLISKVPTSSTVRYIFDGRVLDVACHGAEAKIIDYTHSRVFKKNTVIFSDMGADEALFTQPNIDRQFEVYKEMRECNGNNWATFTPRTNNLWLHYLADKLCNGVPGKKPRNFPLKRREEVFTALATVLDYDSVSQFVRCSREFADALQCLTVE